MGFEVKGCVNQLELFTFEQALRGARRFHTFICEDCADSEAEETQTRAVFRVIMLMSDQPV